MMADVNAFGAAMLSIFFFGLFFFYVTIRRGWLAPAIAGGLSAVINVVVLIAFGFTQDNMDDGFVIATAFGVGLTFSGMMTVMAIFFKNNEPQTLKAYDAMLDKQRNQQQ